MLGAITRSFKCQKQVPLQRSSAILQLFPQPRDEEYVSLLLKSFGIWEMQRGWSERMKLIKNAGEHQQSSCSKQPLSRFPPVSPPVCCRPLRSIKGVHETNFVLLWWLLTTGGDPFAWALIYSSQTQLFSSRFFSSLKIPNQQRTLYFIIIPLYLTNKRHIFVKFTLFQLNVEMLSSVAALDVLAPGWSSCLFPISSQRCVNWVGFF